MAGMVHLTARSAFVWIVVVASTLSTTQAAGCGHDECGEGDFVCCGKHSDVCCGPGVGFYCCETRKDHNSACCYQHIPHPIPRSREHRWSLWSSWLNVTLILIVCILLTSLVFTCCCKKRRQRLSHLLSPEFPRRSEYGAVRIRPVVLAPTEPVSEKETEFSGPSHPTSSRPPRYATQNHQPLVPPPPPSYNEAVLDAPHVTVTHPSGS